MTDNQNNNQTEWNQVFSLYNKFINNRDDKEIRNLFFTTSVNYVIKYPSCIICQKPEFCTELIFCFSCPPTGILVKFREALELQFRECANCIEVYHEKLLPEFYKASLPQYGESGLDKFIKDMIEWDVKRLSTHLDILIKQLFDSKEDIVQWKKVRSQSVFPLYEIIKYPIVMKSYDVETKFLIILKHLLERKTKLTLLNSKMPGILVLALHSSDFIRNWTNVSFQSYKCFSLFKSDDLKSFFENINLYLKNNLPPNSFEQLECGKLNKYYHYTENINDFLHGICKIISVIPSDILVDLQNISAELFKRITLLFNHWSSMDVKVFFNTMETFFKTLKHKIWNIDNTTNNDIISIFKQILNNETYKKILSNTEIFKQIPTADQSNYFNWIFYFSQTAESSFPLVSVELLKYAIEQTNEWCPEARECYKLFVFEAVQCLKKVEVVDILLQYCLKEIKDSEKQAKLIEITKEKVKEDTLALIENHKIICDLDQSKFNPIPNHENENQSKDNIKSIHLLTWRYICSLDFLKVNKEIFDSFFNSIQQISFIFSDRHNFNQYVDNLVFIRRYIVNLFEELSEQTIDTLKGFFIDESKLSVLVHNLFSCDDTIVDISCKVLDKIMVKNIDDSIFDPVVLVFIEHSNLCIKLLIDKLNEFNLLSKDKDIFCMLHFTNSIVNTIDKLIPNIGKITKSVDIKNSFMASIFNFLYQVVNRSSRWIKYQPNERLLISQVLQSSLNLISKMVKMIKSYDAECDFYNFKNELVHFISPLSKQLIYENGRIYFDKIFNLMLNILSFIEPPNKLEDKYLNILKKIYESNSLLPVHKEKLYQMLNQLEGINNSNNNSNNAYGISYPMINSNQLSQPVFNVNVPYQQQYLNQAPINFINNSTLVGVNQANCNVQKANSSESMPSLLAINNLSNPQNNIFQQSSLQSENNTEIISITSDSKSVDNINNSEDVIIVEDTPEPNTFKKAESNSPISLDELMRNNEEKEKELKLKKIQEDMKKSILSNYKHQSKITDMRPLSPNQESKYPIKTPFTMNPKKVSVQKSIKIFSTTQSTDALLNSKPISSNPVHKMSSNVFSPSSPPPFPSGQSFGMKQPKSLVRVKSPKYSSSSSGGKLSKLQSLRKDFNIQRDHLQTRRVPCGQLSKQTHSNPNFDNNSKLKEELEDSSSSEEDGEGILDLLKDYSQGDGEPVIKEKRTIKMLDDTPVIINKKKVIGKSVISDVLKKKSNIDIKVLHRHVLSWNYQMGGNKPPGINSLVKIPVSFKSHEEYVKVFEPLILTECWAQFQKSKEDIDIENDIIKLILEDRCSVDDFEEIKFSAKTEEIRGKSFSENDILYLRSDDKEGEKSKYTFFVLISNITIKKNEAILSCRAYFRGGNFNLISSLRKTSAWKTTKVFSCVTCNREYLAMKFMENSNLLKVILEPQDKESNKKIIESRYVANLMEKYKLNESQAQSICGSVKSKDGFTLIQGPPGTGKTKTILSLIAELKEKALPKKIKILVCAPSNAGCDEIVRRLKRGVQKNNSELYKPKLVRIGTEAIHPDCKDVTLDALVDDLFSNDMVSQSNISKSNQSESALRTQLEDLHKKLEDLRKKEEDVIVNKHDDILQQEISLKIGELIRKRKEIRQALESTQVKSKQILEQARQHAKQKVLNDADIVLSTLGGSGHDILSNIEGGFEIVIVDEAAQAVELSSLIPLKYGATKVILVGDPNQLPPTVISLLAQNYSYEQSLFKRLQINNPDSVYLLNVQYRMHPHISKFPSKHFYNSKIVNSMNMEKLRFQPWHNDKRFRPYQIINVEGRESSYGTSLINQSEVDSIITLVRSLCDMNPSINFATRIGIITPYNGQSKLLKRKFNSVFGSKILHYIDINTIDGFQGQEKDIIIFSCVRAHPKSGSIGFVADVRRMNVGITRARNSLFIVGHLSSLIKNEEWKSLIEDGKERKAISDFTKSNYEYNHSKIPLNIYSSAIKLNDDDTKNKEKENKPVLLKRGLNDTEYSDQISKKEKLIKEEKEAKKRSKKQSDENDIDDTNSNKEQKRKEHENKKVNSDSLLNTSSIKEMNENKSKIDSIEMDNKKTETIKRIKSPSLKERYKEKVEERENNKAESTTKIKSPSLKERYKEKIDERDSKKIKLDTPPRIKSPNSENYKDKTHKSKSSHHHHHHRHSSSHSSHSSHSKHNDSSLKLNNDTFDPKILLNETSNNEPVDLLDKLVNSLKTTEKIAKDKHHKYSMKDMRRY
ncbi:hypothetical protein BCR36DRAFT_50492 [Piromyces finnis]|uniref:AAA+ ATPase domain-containing protein n=1 Tax=Piromyces finnis TaxID=1754191 RepID=A0A1Y1VMB4_9FUNG|nr:hypothetical protein BCR36DRAFT_50492 [Piromyces finnis]|eukprot:ORX60067.1 hypothetical protein BCR36DRAFT_50492 [Piromyces finnis]